MQLFVKCLVISVTIQKHKHRVNLDTFIRNRHKFILMKNVLILLKSFQWPSPLHQPLKIRPAPGLTQHEDSAVWLCVWPFMSCTGGRLRQIFISLQRGTQEGLASWQRSVCSAASALTPSLPQWNTGSHSQNRTPAILRVISRDGFSLWSFSLLILKSVIKRFTDFSPDALTKNSNVFPSKKPNCQNSYGLWFMVYGQVKTEKERDLLYFDPSRIFSTFAHWYTTGAFIDFKTSWWLLLVSLIGQWTVV